MVDDLVDKNILQYLRHKGKVVFVEGTDVNLLNELRIARKKLSSDIDFGAEVMKRVRLLHDSREVISSTKALQDFSIFRFITLPCRTMTRCVWAMAFVMSFSKKANLNGA